MESAPAPITTTTTTALQDRVAIVTGASRGIGKAIALHLASLGAKLVINYSSPSSQSLAEQLVSQINSLSSSSSSSTTPRAIAVQADISDETQVISLFNTTEQTFNTSPHILVTSAGVLDSSYSTIFDLDVSEFDRIFSVNTRGTFLCIKEAAKRIKRGGGGRIVTISSSLAAGFREKFGAYTASKAAVEAMTKILAKELKGSGITVNAVAPGPIATEMFYAGKTEEMVQRAIDESPLKRLGKVEDVAPVVGFLVSDGGEWVNGQIIRVNGGYI
ncbi:NADPH-dependent aldehyde reductase-like protein, chloroplastic [Amaranthus tricolor]|uniref:NADPH-dependent aldehyde reductase-like protein, chloroplastic n=1 Tax=Amaranthus tricolor TaxID=29722 RepID=UPI00258DD5A4|nr:NADPH-dependent aldehyde reductase-like protein, chloroplastic [Amaranthus tricolor]